MNARISPSEVLNVTDKKLFTTVSYRCSLLWRRASMREPMKMATSIATSNTFAITAANGQSM